MFELPGLAELTERAHVVSLPMRVKFRGVEHREALLLEGPAGWGEFSPFLEYAPAEASSWLAAAIEAAWWGYPEPVREEIPVNATLPAVGPERVAQVLSNYDAVHTIKVKVAEQGQDLAQDVARVAEVRRLFPDAHIRIDANAGWTFDEATLALEALAGFGLQYAEQPVASIEDLSRLRKHVQARELGVLIAADESVRKEEDPLAVARAGAADLIVIKAQPLGGVRRALEIVAQAGLPAVVSSALDTSVGLRQGRHWPPPCPNCPTPAVWPRDPCLSRTSPPPGSSPSAVRCGCATLLRIRTCCGPKPWTPNAVVGGCPGYVQATRSSATKLRRRAGSRFGNLAPRRAPRGFPLLPWRSPGARRRPVKAGPG